MVIAAAIAALVLAQSETSWAAEVRVGARARSPGGTDGAGEVAADVEVAPRLGGSVTGHGYNLGVTYGATFRARQPHLSFRPEHSHVATLQAGWRRDGRARPFMFIAGTYGVVDLTNLASPIAAPQQGATETTPQADPNDPNAPPPETEVPQAVPQVPLDPIPRLESLLAYGIDSSLGVEVPLSPLVSWTTTAGFFHGGGADAFSRNSLPVQNSPRASTRLDWHATRLDNLAVIADARMSWFASREEAGQAELLLAWRRQLLQSMTLELRAGAAGSMNRSAPPPDPAEPAPQRSWRLFPAGSVNWAQHFDLRTWWGLGLWASAGAGPHIDRYRAIAYAQVNWQGGLNATLRDWLSLRFGGGASMALGAEQQIGRLVTTWLDGSIALHPQRWWRADLTAARSVVTTDIRLADGSPTPAVVQWVIGVGLTVVGQGDI